jgi:hypothetical protein
MRIHRAAALLAVVALLSVGATAAHAETIPADQPMSLVSPAPGKEISSPYPKFTWVLPPAAGNESLVVSTSPTTVDSRLPDSGKAYYMSEFPTQYATSVKSTYVYQPGTYYWQVTAQEGATHYVSPVQKFVVPTVFVLTKFRAKIAKNGANNINQVEVNGVLKCSVGYNTKHDKLLTIQIFKGKKKIGSQTREAGDCNSMTKTREFANFQPQPGSIKRGTKLTVKVFASYGKEKSAVEVLKVTWK